VEKWRSGKVEKFVAETVKIYSIRAISDLNLNLNLNLKTVKDDCSRRRIAQLLKSVLNTNLF
jgi:hypothetical protein